jgi:TPR repeat protein
MSNTSELENNMSACANCGKGEEAGINLKACTACKLVKYCNRDCQIAHRSQHKKECKKRAKELHDELLFKQPPPLEDCAICFLRLPTLGTGTVYMACCGKVICRGCRHAPVYDHQGNEVDNEKCPFCRTPTPISYDEAIKRYEKRLELNDPIGICDLGVCYALGQYGLPQNYAKALELFQRAGELGYADAIYNIGIAYSSGRGVEVDKKKAKHYYELAAINGSAYSRHNLGIMDENEGNYDRALKHYMIAASCGCIESVQDSIKLMYKNGLATKDDYANALRSYQAYLDEIKSDQRDEAAALNDEYKYFGSITM